jgi:tRNA U55 pseudouridine synthase TruB
MSELERTGIGAFSIEEALPLRDVTPSTLHSHRLPAALAVANWPQVTVDCAQLSEITFGRAPVAPESAPIDSDVAILDEVGELVAFARVRDGKLHPTQVFVTPDELPGRMSGSAQPQQPRS